MPSSISERDTAPALSRGVALLNQLNASGPASLEFLSRQTTWPKSSVARLLSSLEQQGLITRDPSTYEYTALYRLVRSQSADDAMRTIAPSYLAQLTQASGHATEIYTAHAVNGSLDVRMIDRSEPENTSVHVRARVGHVRDLSELEALAQVAFTHSPPARSTQTFWVWKKGAKKKLPTSQARKLIQEAAQRNMGLDADVNEHGVYRYAVPLLSTCGGLLGLLALAQLCPLHGAVPPDPHLMELLRSVGRDLQAALEP